MNANEVTVKVLTLFGIVILSISGLKVFGQDNGKETTDTIMPTKVIQLDREIFLKEVWNYADSASEWKFKGKLPVIIDFYADWCVPCRIASPALDELSAQYSGRVIFYKVNTQIERELVAVFGISTIPSFLYIPLIGKPLMTIGISRTLDGIKPAFEKNIKEFLDVKN